MSNPTGRIIKGIAGFYYVYTGKAVYECKAKGRFRKDGKKPLVGDVVEFAVLSEEKKEGNILDLQERSSQMIRPAVANVDQAMIIFALESPKPNTALLDKLLLMMQWQHIPTLICFNKADLATEADMEAYRKVYTSCGFSVLFTSAQKEEGLAAVKRSLAGRITVVAGPSGVGKSTMTNSLQSDVVMETGDISRKLKRGKHTTRHAQMIELRTPGWIIDTPGFSALDLIGVDKEELRAYYPEFWPFEGKCRYNGCNHMDEPDCAVKQALRRGVIAQNRYENYRMFFNELKEREKKKY